MALPPITGRAQSCTLKPGCSPSYSGTRMSDLRRLETVHVVRTPEYVEFEYPLAGTGARFLAWLLDSLISIAASILVTLALGFMSVLAGGMVRALQFIIGFLISW